MRALSLSRSLPLSLASSLRLTSRGQGTSEREFKTFCPRAPNYSALCPFPPDRNCKKGKRRRETDSTDAARFGPARKAQKQNEKDMEIVQFAWSPPPPPGHLFEPTRRQTTIKIKSLALSLSRARFSRSRQGIRSIHGVHVPAYSAFPIPRIASWNRDLNFGVDCAIRARPSTHA